MSAPATTLARGLGLGRRIVDELRHQARLTGYEKLCAFTHEPGYFVRLGFSMVPHPWVPEKIAHDCQGCELFRRCGQHAVTLALRGQSHAISTTSARSSASVTAALPAVEG
jgi:N-acetylglutamate synthase-like GNAT family acetyltransferase